MNTGTGTRPFHLKNRIPTDPEVKPIAEWVEGNVTFYTAFRRWLRDGGYGESALATYGTAARIALGWLNKPYRVVDPKADLDRVRVYIATRYPSAATQETYRKGINKLAEYLRYRCHREEPERQPNWEYHTGSLPDWLADDVRSFVAHLRRTWELDVRHRRTGTTLSHLTLFLRWAAESRELADLRYLTPQLWSEYVDLRLDAGRSAVTINCELRLLQGLLSYLKEQGREVCERTLRVQPLKEANPMPRDVPLDRLSRLLREVETTASGKYPKELRMGIMDRAWVLLMVHCGLRTGEVRRMVLSDLNLKARRVRIEKSKGLKDRIVYLSPATVEAVEVYLAVRGPAATDQVFIHRHAALKASYCSRRLRTYGERCGVLVTPHQLRHTCATLLLNAGAPPAIVQAILGHRHIDTTMNYARLYDSTVATDYFGAMTEIEARMTLADDGVGPAVSGGQLLALVDTLRNGTLNEDQRQTVLALRTGILLLVATEGDVG